MKHVFGDASESNSIAFGFEHGALYNRRDEIHGKFGGQRQGGISTPANQPVVLLFTGESGKGHGYDDYWDDDGIFHYVGEGQRGDMAFKGGNHALLQHRKEGKAVLLFQALGKSKPYRFVGEFALQGTYEKDGVLDTDGNPRSIIVFKLKPIEAQEDTVAAAVIYAEGLDEQQNSEPTNTTCSRIVEVRTKQQLFRRRVERIETACRITGVCDTRFLRASHIKPWSKAAKGEQVDGNNGLLLAPHVDVLFNDGWISFTDEARLLLNPDLPPAVIKQLGLSLWQGQQCGRPFNANQKRYMAFHRANEYVGSKSSQ